MPVDTSIYSQVSKGGNISDLVESYNKGVEARQQRKLSDLALSKAEREAAQGKALNDAYASNISPEGKINRQRMISQLSAGGHGMAIPQLQQAWSTQDKSEAETLEKRLDVAKKQVDYFHGTMAGLLAMPDITDDALIRATSNAVNRGYISQDQALEFIRDMPPDQTSRRAILMDGIAQSVDAAKQLELFSPKVSAQNLGGHTQMVDTNPLTNPGVVGQRLERSATPGDLITDRHNRASEGLQVRGQNMADARAREQMRGQIVTDANGGVQLVNPITGEARPVTGAGGEPVIGKGGLSSKQIENARAKKQTVEILKKQVENLKAARANLGEMDYGIVAGRQSITDTARAYDAALAAAQTTVRQLTRTPGEGSTSDYESRLSQAQLPNRVDPIEVIDQKIGQLEDMTNIIEEGYTDILNRNGNRGTGKKISANQNSGSKDDGRVVDFSDLK